MKELTFNQVVNNIKEGEVWESLLFDITMKDGDIRLYLNCELGEYCLFDKDSLYRLKEKPVEFSEAFQGYQEFKLVKSLKAGRIFKRGLKDILTADKVEIEGKWEVLR